jgi:hypothetical protein
MSINSERVVTGSGPSFNDALQDVLEQVIRYTTGRDTPTHESGRSIRITAEAPTQPELIVAALQEVSDIGRSYEEAIVSVQIDACRPIEGGMRFWARAGLSSSDNVNEASFSVTCMPVVSSASGSTTIEVAISITS